jgi:hypothetical protein
MSSGVASDAMAAAMVRARSGAEIPVVTPFARLDRHREGGAEAARVLLRHKLQAEPLNLLVLHGEADQPAAVFRHEIDGFRRRHLGRDHQVALVLPILVVDQDEHAPVARFVDDLLDRRQERQILRGPGDVLFRNRG